MKTKNIQKRSIEVIEYEDGSYLFAGGGWDLKIPPNEAIELFSSWKTGELEKNNPVIKLPEIFKN